MFWHYVVVFFISLLSISLELFFTRVLNLKTFNHVVYVVIPFTMLGLGIGANLYFLTKDKIAKYQPEKIYIFGLMYLAIVDLICLFSISYTPINLGHLKRFFVDVGSAFMLISTYLLITLPFIGIGYLLIYIFAKHPKKSTKLYFWDLLGAGLGAALFFYLIYTLQIFHSILALSIVAAVIALLLAVKCRKHLSIATTLLVVLSALFLVPEIQNYPSQGKGWENFPETFEEDQYETLFRRWHPMGRTDTYRLTKPEDQMKHYFENHWVFQINVDPIPDYSFLSTNFLAGTPVFNYPEKASGRLNSNIKLFSQPMELPYVILNEPKVVVIGAGGGRDVFMALTHDAQEVIAAEINPAIYWAMKEGGPLYDYSRGIYSHKKVKTYNIDGRNMVKILNPNNYDLVVLNGVDTFSGLSSGAYTFAESYLYTKEAIMDYLTILNDDGVINFNRWLFDPPRETLRLFVVAIEALREMNVENPWDHIIVGTPLGMLLIKKTPFTDQERKQLTDHFDKMNALQIYPIGESLSKIENPKGLINFDRFIEAYKQGKEKEYIKNYPYDISVITDDKPYFYKYYRFKDISMNNILGSQGRGAGFYIFFTQILVLFNAYIFILAFIYIPLAKYGGDQLKRVPGGSVATFVLYFACIGISFMFIEIALMQQFVLLLGSPIYSISITLAALLIFTGLGSLLLNKFEKLLGGADKMLICTCGILFGTILLLLVFKNSILGSFISQSFGSRVFIVSTILLPIGLCLGIFFPSGLQLITGDSQGSMSWAWAINFGFSVVGSILAIILSQIFGFKCVILIALFIYGLATILFCKMVNNEKSMQ